MSAQVDVLGAIDALVWIADQEGQESEADAGRQARADVAALIAERDALQERLNTNRCNRGHETLPLTLWDCPECHNETRLERDALRTKLEGLIEASKRMDAMHAAMMKEANHGASFYSAGTLHEMNAAPIALAKAVALALTTGESA